MATEPEPIEPPEPKVKSSKLVSNEAELERNLKDIQKRLEKQQMDTDEIKGILDVFKKLNLPTPYDPDAKPTVKTDSNPIVEFLKKVGIFHS